MSQHFLSVSTEALVELTQLMRSWGRVRTERLPLLEYVFQALSDASSCHV